MYQLSDSSDLICREGDMGTQSTLKLKQRFALVVAFAFAVAAAFMSISMYGDLRIDGAISTELVVFKAVSVAVSILFCATNVKMAMLAREDRLSAETA